MVDFVRDMAYNKVGYVWLFENSTERGSSMEYMSIRETAKKWGISSRRVQVLCVEERIPGVFRIGNMWAIPADAEKPNDARIKSGRYIKEQNQ